MRIAGKILPVLVTALVAWFYVFTGTPVFGPTLKIKTTPIAAIELSMFATNRVITASNQCEKVIRTMRKARESPVAATPAFGTLTLCYADGTTNMFYLQPGSRLNGLDLVDQAGSHTISMGEMFGTLESVGLLTKDQR